MDPINSLGHFMQNAARAKIGLAVSGGGDSMALMHAAIALKQTGLDFAVATVDHGLRKAAADEAKFVASICDQHDIQHSTLHWTPGQPRNNLMSRARDARYDLLANWAKSLGIQTVLLAHTAEDQAETFLIRLARGSSAHGLAAMQATHYTHEIIWGRPFLGLTRVSLRQFLQNRGADWIDDPSNDNPQFTRILFRQSQPVLDDLGLTKNRLIQTAQNMARVRDAIDHYTDDLANRTVSQIHGAIKIDRPEFDAAPDEIRLRLLSKSLQWVAQSTYAPRQTALLSLLNAPTPSRHTQNGCIIRWNTKTIFIAREWQAIADLTVPSTAIWDRRWRLIGAPVDAQIGPIGPNGLKNWPDWQAMGLWRDAALCLPGVFKNGILHQIPFDPANPVRAELITNDMIKSTADGITA